MKLGIIARADRTGLGNQTRSLVRMLNPEKVLVIDSTPFNGNEQDFTFFKDKNAAVVMGFPSDAQLIEFMSGLDAILSCETFYNNNLTTLAKNAGVKTILQPNWEFFDWNLPHYNYPLPDALFVPSPWHLQDFNKFDTKVWYLPPPVFVQDFRRIEDKRLRSLTKPRFLHNAGKVAHMDRNGTQALLDAISHVKGDFELVIKVQHSNGHEFNSSDPRVTFDYSDTKRESDIYVGFNAMILPRRYAGLCLPMLEALASGLPVIMTDISPNKEQLPKEWLAKATKTDSFMARTEIDVYTVDQKDLVKRIEWMLKNLASERQKAYNIIHRYSSEQLFKTYDQAIFEIVNE